MKKVILGSIFLLTLCAGVARADMIPPKIVFQDVTKIDKEELLKACLEFKEKISSTENAEPGSATSKIYRMYLDSFYALNCDKVLQEAAQTANSTEKTPQSSNPAPDTGENKQDFRDYGLAGMLVLLLSGGAFVLLWRSRKTMPRAL